MSKIHFITVMYFTFFAFFENPKNVTFYVFCFASHVFSNYDQQYRLIATHIIVTESQQ